MDQSRKVPDRPAPVACEKCGRDMTQVARPMSCTLVPDMVWYESYHPDVECLSNQIADMREKMDRLLVKLISASSYKED